MRIRDVVSEAENIVELFVVHVFKANHAPNSLREQEDHLSLDLESVKKEIKALTAEVKKIYDENMYDINGVAIKILKHSSTRHGGIGTYFQALFYAFSFRLSTLSGMRIESYHYHYHKISKAKFFSGML
ncbi:hypothetical protein RHMOL_Rhmol12G0243500 [Rhododendron molle]|uniref:Uncharacterized protein n=1 Tax=Rhododendron molle TaxID=49168 RepID=A0ACC0LM21_RHOML|nr:hypothetical protein RHMOL_Rhmol12G0243500 [Rhododendron molle]